MSNPELKARSFKRRKVTVEEACGLDCLTTVARVNGYEVALCATNVQAIRKAWTVIFGNCDQLDESRIQRVCLVEQSKAVTK